MGEHPHGGVSAKVLAAVSRFQPQTVPSPAVLWMEEAEAWLVTSYEAIHYVLRNDERLFRLAHPEAAPAQAVAALRGGKRTHRLLRGDEHERIHRWYMKWFLPHEVERYADLYIRPEVELIIDRFAQHGRAELCHQFCEPLGPRVIAAVLGLPVRSDNDAYFQQAQGYNDAILAWNGAPENREVLAAGITASHALNEMLLPTIRARKAEPRADLISRMWAEGPSIVDGWGEEDVLVATREMILGASGTTREALANALHLLLTDRNVLEAVLRDPAANWPNFVEESLRLQDSRIIVAIPRVANEDVQIAGVPVKRDDLVVMLTDLGNVDERHYADPTVVHLSRRSPKDHFVFGAGPRACIGANLGRRQVRTALELVFGRLPRLALDSTAEPPFRSGVGGGFGKSSYAPLHVTF